MKVITNPAEFDKVAIAATIGMFDGVHLGHVVLLDSLHEAAKARGLATAVVTFRNHPQNVLHHGDVRWIYTLEDRVKSIANHGVDYLILMDFTPELAQLDSTAFMQMLRDDYGLKALVVGFNHRFGHNRSETFADYKANGAKLRVDVVQAKEYDGELAPVSSSIIRKYISEGDVEAAMKRLEHPFCVSGEVVHGLKNGRKIGFPTANLSGFPKQMILPPNGAYAALVRVASGPMLPAMANVGKRPTVVEDAEVNVEVNILDFDRDIYHLPLTVYFVKRLRPETRYGSLEELKKQLRLDREHVRAILTEIQTNK